jgi:DNA-binding transcriptional ArsR family regulator
MAKGTRRQNESGPGAISPEDMADHAEAATQLLRALANPNRLMILCVLSNGEMSVGALNDRVDLSQSALSQHLSVLRRDELVETRRDRQNVYYRLADGPALNIINTLHDLYCN